jgi:hypothetical protein
MSENRVIQITKGKSIINLEEYKHTTVYLHDVVEVTKEKIKAYDNTDGKIFYNTIITIKHSDGSSTDINLFSYSGKKALTLKEKQE